MAGEDREWMTDAKCRGTSNYRLYESDNRGGGQAERLERACGGCTVKPECASYALQFANQDECIGGTVWAGIPVPESPSTIFYHRALDRLRVIAEGHRDAA
ncbi:WhiB family transcriptional regulator [Nocardia sp. CA-128927]|uniref:WhiB family transcriptional regulator n=1 Tax=Nocardia sp. CA-128927 TaxID=3239975 RepID=UPI003D992DB4